MCSLRVGFVATTLTTEPACCAGGNRLRKVDRCAVRCAFFRIQISKARLFPCLMRAQRTRGGDHGHVSVVTEAGAGAVGAPDMPSVYAHEIASLVA